MIEKAIKSLKNINYKLFVSLLVLGLCPTIYMTVRTFILGSLPGEWSFSIAGQLGWVNLIYEILNEAIILPLFYFVGKVINDKEQLQNRITTGLVITFCVYILLAVIMVIFVNPMLKFMAVDKNIINESATYIRLESIANIFTILANFTLVVLVSLNKDKYIYILTGAKLLLSIIFDTFLVSNLPISLKMGVNGIAVTNIIVNLMLFIISILLLARENIKIFSKQRLSFSWAKDFFRIGGISGLESLVRNVAYMIMISRMVNVVSEQGTYWVANNFIWGWLLLPVLQLAELIKQEIATDNTAIQNNTLGYFILTGFICIVWFITMPLWKLFMGKVLNFSDVDKLFNLVLVLVGFYVLFAFQNVFDSTFYGLGKTNYMLFESIVTNSLYYGVAFIFYKTGLWIPSLTGIALMFGIGMAFDSIVSLFAYIYLLKKKQDNIIIK